MFTSFALQIIQSLNVVPFFQDYLTWMNNLTSWQFIGIISFILVDLLRNVGKPVVLSIHQLFRKLHPLQFQSTESAQIKISVLVPAHNEGVAIRKTIDRFNRPIPYCKSARIKLVERSEGSKGSKSGDRVTKIKDVIKKDDINTILARNVP